MKFSTNLGVGVDSQSSSTWLIQKVKKKKMQLDIKTGEYSVPSFKMHDPDINNIKIWTNP